MDLWCGRTWLTFIDVTFNHDTHDTLLALFDLFGDDLGNLGLIAVFLLAVSMRAVDHDFRSQALGGQLLLGLSNTLTIVVCAGGAAPENDEAVLIPNGAHDGDDPWFRD